MKRLLIALALAGCVPPGEQSQARQQLDAACKAGDMAACATVMQADEARRANAAAAFRAAGANMQAQAQQPAYQVPIRTRQQCTFQRMGDTVYQNCY